MFDRCVVAYDGSEEADAAVGVAFDLAGQRDPQLAFSPGIQLTLAHVVELPHPHAADTPEMVRGFKWLLDQDVEDWRERLAGIAAGAPEGASVKVEVRADRKPAGALLDVLVERQADLLVAGTRGVGGLKRALLGSVSQQLLDHAPCSILLVRRRVDSGAPRVVVAGIDGSAATRGVVAAAERAARALSAQLVLAYVVDDRVSPSGWSIETTSALRKWARELGERAIEEAGQAVTMGLHSELREGRAPDELVALCEERQPVLAVVGSRGLHGFQRLLVGSTARYLVNHAPCPVLVARTTASP